MKPAAILLLCLALCGCDRKKFPDRVRGVDTYDGCEYVVFQTSAGDYTWTHKGNCTNVIHGTTIPSNSGGFWRYEGPVFPKGYIENSEPTKPQ